jgi:hypothetical protein
MLDTLEQWTLSVEGQASQAIVATAALLVQHDCVIHKPTKSLQRPSFIQFCRAHRAAINHCILEYAETIFKDEENDIHAQCMGDTYPLDLKSWTEACPTIRLAGVLSRSGYQIASRACRILAVYRRRKAQRVHVNKKRHGKLN